MARRGMNFGIFIAPFHRIGGSPTLAIARDIERIEHLDRLGSGVTSQPYHHPFLADPDRPLPENRGARATGGRDVAAE